MKHHYAATDNRYLNLKNTYFWQKAQWYKQNTESEKN